MKRKIRHHVFASSTKRENKTFQQGDFKSQSCSDGEEMYKKIVMHVQSCCFTNYNHPITSYPIFCFIVYGIIQYCSLSSFTEVCDCIFYCMRVSKLITPLLINNLPDCHANTDVLLVNCSN